MPIGYKHTKETKEKIRNSRLGYVVSNNTKIKLSKIQKGRKHTKEHIEKVALANTGKKRTIAERIKISNSHKGQMPWNKGLVVDSIKKKNLRDSFEYRLWRELVFERDDWTCKKCLERGVELNSHHVFNFSDNEELRFNTDNGVTLCKKCHREFHKIYGIKNNNKEQLKEYLNK